MRRAGLLPSLFRVICLLAVFLGPLGQVPAVIIAEGDVVPDPETTPWDPSTYGTVGVWGYGSLTVNDGCHLYSSGACIGHNAPATGEVVISGTASTWTNGGPLLVGFDGSGTLEVALGGIVTTEQLCIYHGTLTVGGGANVSVVGSVESDVMDEGRIVMDGGTLSTSIRIRLCGEHAALTGHGLVNSALWGYCWSGTGLTADGGTLRVGDATRTDGVWFSGPATVNDNAVIELMDADRAYVGKVTLQNGVFIARNGADVDSDLEGYGIVVGDVRSLPSPTGTVNLEQTFDVGSSVARIYSATVPSFSNGVTLGGGQIISPLGLRILNSGSLFGHGIVDAVLHGDCPMSTGLIASGGTLRVGDATRTDGVDFFGRVSIDDNATLELLDANEADLSNLILDNGVLIARNGVNFLPTARLRGVVIGMMSITDPVITGTVNMTQAIDVGASVAEVYSTDVPAFGGSVTLGGGRIISPNGMTISSGGNLNGYGMVETSLGTGTANPGQITLLDQNVVLDGGSISPTETLLVSGGSISGHGAVTGQTINNGLIQVAGGTLDCGPMIVAQTGGTQGAISVSGDGSVLSVSAGSLLSIGHQGIGTLMIESGGAVQTGGALSLGTYGGSDGTATVVGENSMLAVSSEFNVGGYGVGRLDITSGGMVSAAGMNLGNKADATGTITVNGDGAALSVANGWLQVGPLGTGTITIKNGGALNVANTSYLVVGSYATGNGEIVVTGADSTMESLCGCTLGAGGTGSLTVAVGGSVTIRGLSIGNDPGSRGDATVTGAGSTLAMSGGEGMVIGSRGTGSLTIGQGSKVTAASAWIALWSDGTGTLNLTGGTLDTSGGTINVGSNGKIKGWGTLIGNVTVAGGTIESGDRPGMLGVGGNFALDDAATLVISLAGTSPGEFDRVEVTREVTLDGTLDVRCVGGFLPSAGDSFDILDWTMLTGTFDEVLLPVLEGGLCWETDDLYVSGTLMVVSSTWIPGDTDGDNYVDEDDAATLAAHWGQSGAREDGDFNGDGVINAADAAILAANWSPASPTEENGPTNPVPEPATLALALALSLAALSARQKRAKPRPSRNKLNRDHQEKQTEPRP